MTIPVAAVFFGQPASDPLRLRFAPRLASWNAAGDPDQIRLAAALEDASDLLGPRIATLDGALSLRLEVGLPEAVPLLDEHDLDNYALPLASHLISATGKAFVSVWCSKRTGSESFVWVEPARMVTCFPDSSVRFDVQTTASTTTTEYKQQIHEQVESAHPLSDGPVSLQLAFVVGPRRNWLNLWKPTIDALDPLLGRTRADRDWHPKDGRIVELGLHCTVDPDAGNDVTLAILASPATVD